MKRQVYFLLSFLSLLSFGTVSKVSLQSKHDDDNNYSTRSSNSKNALTNYHFLSGTSKDTALDYTLKITYFINDNQSYVINKISFVADNNQYLEKVLKRSNTENIDLGLGNENDQKLFYFKGIFSNLNFTSGKRVLSFNKDLNSTSLGLNGDDLYVPKNNSRGAERRELEKEWQLRSEFFVENVSEQFYNFYDKVYTKGSMLMGKQEVTTKFRLYLAFFELDNVSDYSQVDAPKQRVILYNGFELFDARPFLVRFSSLLYTVAIILGVVVVGGSVILYVRRSRKRRAVLTPENLPSEEEVL